MSTGLSLLFVYVGGALAISFLCSLLEAALLSVRETELAARAEAGERGAAILLELKRERLDDAISAILTLNTIAHTIGATLAGAQAAHIFGDAWVGAFSAVLTLLVLVVTEIIPKTLGAVNASRLAGFVGRTTTLLITVLAPVIAVTGALTRLLTRKGASPITRGEITALLAVATAQGTLRKDQKRLVDNVLRLDEVKVGDVMTPRTVAATLPANTTIAAFLEDRGARVFSRIPLFTGGHDAITGYVVQREVLDVVVSGGDTGQPLSVVARPAWFIPEQIPIGNALHEFLKRREHLAVVVDEYGGVTGLVTLEDLIETILGVEIVDESDRIIDMRRLAMSVRDRRLQALHKQRLLVQEPPRPRNGSE